MLAAIIDGGVAYAEVVEVLSLCSASPHATGGVKLGEREGCGLKDGHSRLSPETEVIFNGFSQASIKVRLSLLGLSKFERRATGRGGSGLCGRGLAVDGVPVFLVYMHVR